MQNLLTSLRNFIYIWKWIFVKKWYKSYFYIDRREKLQTGRIIMRETRRISKMKLGEIEGMLFLIKSLRERKLFKFSDFLRNKLISIGTFWKEPKKWAASNLLGHTLNNLDFRAINGRLILSGQIVERNIEKTSTDIYYEA